MNNFAFFGSDEIAFIALQNLFLSKYVNLKIIVCKIPKNKLASDPIFLFCKKHKISFLTYDKEKNFWDNILNIFIKEKITALFCCSFGAIFPLKIINSVKDTFNIHPSFLPRWKGPAPIVYSIRYDQISAVCLIKICEQVDSGQIIKICHFSIKITDNYLKVFQKIIAIINDKLIVWIKDYYNNNFSLINQDKNQETFSKPINFSQRKIDFQNQSMVVYNFIRSFSSLNLPYFSFQKQLFFVANAFFVLEKTDIAAKTIIFSKKILKIYCFDGYIKILEIKKEGGKVLKINNFLNGKLIFKNYDQTQ